MAAADPEWLQYKASWNKNYASLEEENHRFGIFKQTRIRLQKLNNPVFGYTKFSDWTKEEFSVLLGRSQDPKVNAAVEHASKDIEVATPSKIELPESLDWRETSYAVSSVKDQGQCGSCWAFSVAETVESQMVLAGYPPMEYSPQQIAAYTPNMLGCGGGDPVPAYQYIKNGLKNQVVKGLTSNWYCPYTQSMWSQCLENGCTNACGGAAQDWSKHAAQFPVAKIEGFKWQTPRCGANSNCTTQDLPKLKANLAANGPTSVCLNAAPWQDYTGGILQAADCSSNILSVDHCVQLVGYHDAGKGNEKDSYWLVRNSWSTVWGEQGYIRLQLDANTCGVANEASIPIIAPANPTKA